MNKIHALGAVLGLLPAVMAWAQEAPAAKTAEPAIPNDRTNYQGDKLKYSFAFGVTRVDLRKESNNTEVACAPAFTTFKGIGRLKVGNDQMAAFTVTGVPAVVVAPAAAASAVQGSPSATPPTAAATYACEANAALLREGDIVTIKDAMLTGVMPDRYGLTYGTLLVPYKYQLGGDKSFASKASVGGYLGFRQDRSGWSGLALQYVGFIGAATVPVSQTIDGQSQVQQISGVSYGLGILGTVKSEFQMGLVIGADRVSKNANYVNNGKPWIALSLGFAFGG